MKNLNPYYLGMFVVVPSGSSNERIEAFTEFNLDSVYSPQIFTPDGEQLDLRGPVQVVGTFEIDGEQREFRTDKRRFVRVDFYKFTDLNQGKKYFKQAFGWQGDNGLIHLYERTDLLDEDPFTPTWGNQHDLTPAQLDELHKAYLLQFGPTETFEAIT